MVQKCSSGISLNPFYWPLTPFVAYSLQALEDSYNSIVIVFLDKQSLSAEKPGFSKTMTIESINQVYQLEKPSLSLIVTLNFEKQGFSADRR